jgi:EmrB/QacA subfamily drug resistance transporter
VFVGRHPCDEGVVLAAPAARPCAEADRPWVLVTTILGSSLAFVDGTVVNVALPALQRELGASVADVQWVVEAYALLLSALLLVGGAIGDRMGRRRVYASGIALFAAASVACGLAGTVRQLVVARAVQGIGAALLVPGSLAIISASFPAEERGRAIGTWSGSTAVATAAGPVVGGWLIEHVSWRWAFFVNLPVAAVVLGMLFWRIPESRDPDAAGPLDWWGAALVTGGLGGIVYGLVESSRLGWQDARVWGTVMAGAASMIAFVVAESRSRFPMVPLALFRSPSFAGANLLTLFLYGALGSLFFFLPLNLIQVHGYSATAAGAAGLPFVLILSALSRWSGGLIDRAGARVPLVVGPLTSAVGFLLFALPGADGRYWSTFFPAMVVLGLGMAITVPPLTTSVMNAVDVRHAGTASGINNAVARTGGLLAVAVLGVLVLQAFNRDVDRRLATMRLGTDIVAALDAERTKLAAAEVPAGVRASDRPAIQRAISLAFVTAFRQMALVAAALAVLSALTAGAIGDATSARPATGTDDFRALRESM